MSHLDPKTVTLSGLNVIEASAGTGKTYTLAELYLRLILEQGLTVDQVLVVTYTRAATEELRDRLREKLVEARDDLLAEPEHDVVLRQRLSLAIQSFDESAIFTIHGFCQRVLGDFAFESGLSFDLELVGDDQLLLQGMVDDFWRKYITTADSRLAQYLIARRETPETLLQSIRSLLGKPYLQYLPVLEVDIEEVYQQAQTQFERVKQLWLDEQDAVMAALQDKTLLNGNKYRSASVEKWLVLLADLLSRARVPSRLFEGFERFTPAKLDDALKKDKVLPELFFWQSCEDLLEHVSEMQAAQALQYQKLRLVALQTVQAEMPARKQQQQVQSYDDLLLNLEQALSGERGDWLAVKLRGQYPAALIDEFQDTDPVQYASFNRIYAGSDLPVFLVGDPKQAIYSFRGADIFTYLAAKSSTNAEHTLGTNWRSHPKLVSAVNTIFSRQPQPFIYDEIPFHSVAAARDDVDVLSVAGQAAPLQLLWADADKPLSKKDMTALSASVTADEIAKLLTQASADQATLLDEETQTPVTLTGGDIAVLVRNHKQAYVMQQCLQQRGINSVQQGRENVFGSTEALMLERVLKAIAEPDNTMAMTAALGTDLWDYDASSLYALQQDEAAWTAQFELFYDCHQVWLRSGFMRAFRQLLNHISGQQRLLSLPAGERKLTNLLHLAELVQAQSTQQDGGMSSILQWFASRIQSIDPNDETGQLRLESDEQLVHIITIHKSKGLEYPIVFCPFLWDSQIRMTKDEVISFHDEALDYQAYVAFAEPDLTRAAQANKKEQEAESLRLLYVAITRARERCVICWGNAKGVAESGLFSLLHPTAAEADSDLMLGDVTALAAASAGTMSLDVMAADQAVAYQAKQNRQNMFSAKSFEGHIQVPWRVGSFSALTQGHDAELPDYDAQANAEVPIAQVQERNVLDRFSFPRGAQAGTCLHAIFEFLDFASDDDVAIHALVNKTLLQYGFDAQWTQVVCDWVRAVCDTELQVGTGLKLNQLSHSQRLDELAFYFPVAVLSVSGLQQALLPLLAPGSPLAKVISQLQFFDLTGFMKGFIDLVFESQGRFYIVDYKSNHLGHQQAGYQTEELNQAMVSHDYPLQYLIYSLALHRYLRLRLPNYDPEQHLGGAYYLFIRGMQPEWGQAGVFYDKPSTAVLDALDNCLQGLSDG
jgi:exodeoxyribonuclease V beta subunit